MVRLMHSRAKLNPKRVVFTEADHLTVLRAAQIAHDEGIAKPILLGRRDEIERLKAEIEFDAEVPIIDPKSDAELERKNQYAEIYWKQRQRRGVTLLSAQKLMRERNFFAAMMVNEGDADALITYFSRSYPTILKPMLELIGLEKGQNVLQLQTY